MSELKPCPFCGSEAQVNTWTMHGITESRCFCSNSDCPNSVRTVALEQWNTRPIEDDLRKRIAELEEKQRWIPISEKLPEESDWYLPYYIGYRVTYPIYYDVKLGWYAEDKPDYWMPFPESPIVYG